MSKILFKKKKINEIQYTPRFFFSCGTNGMVNSVPVANKDQSEDL